MYCAWRIPAHLRCTQCSILLHLMDICFLTCICVWQISQIQTFLFKVVGPGLVSVLISAPKSTVTLFTQDTNQFQTHPNITLEDTKLPLERIPKILGVIMDPSFFFHKHCNYVTDRIDKGNNMLMATGCSHDTNTQHLHDETNVLPIHQHLQLHASQIRQKAQHPTHPLHKLPIHPHTPRLKKQTTFNNIN